MGMQEQFSVRCACLSARVVASRAVCEQRSAEDQSCLRRRRVLLRIPATSCAGICLLPWLRFLVENKTFINWRLYWQRVLFLTALATLNSIVAAWEAARHGLAIAQQRLHPEPVFILGHPRTGTTQ